MEPYNQNLPFIRLANDGKTILDRLAEAGIPLTRALQYFRDNPKGPASETLNLATEDVVPFYGNYRNGGDWSDYAKEAVLLAAPMPKGSGKRYKVNTDVNGVPNFNDLQKWGKDKVQQYDNLLESSPSNRLAKAQKDLDNFNKFKKYMYPKVADKLEPRLRQDVTTAALDVLDETPYYSKVESWGRIPDNAPGKLKGQVNAGKYIYDKLVDEYGPEAGSYYYHKLWESDYNSYPGMQELGVDHDLLERMFNKYYK